MRSVNYELQGKEVPAALVGVVVPIAIGETYKECESLTEKGESDVCAKFNDGRVIAIQGGLRTKAAKALKDAGGDKAKASAALAEWAKTYKYTVRAEGTGVAKPKTAAGRARSTAQQAGNKLFDRLAGEVAQGNSQNLDRLVKQGFVDRDEFNAYVTAKQEAEKEAQAPKSAPATATK